MNQQPTVTAIKVGDTVKFTLAINMKRVTDDEPWEVLRIKDGKAGIRNRHGVAVNTVLHNLQVIEPIDWRAPSWLTRILRGEFLK